MTESLVIRQDTGNDPSKVPLEMNDILKIRGVDGIFLIGNNGAVMSADGWLEPDTDGLSACSLRLIFESGMIADRVRDGPLIQIFLEFKDRILIIEEADHDRLIAVIASPDANIGQISYHMNKRRQKPVPAL